MNKINKATVLTETEYYNAIGNLGDTFTEIHTNWYNIFNYILLSVNNEFTTSVVSSLFYEFDMENWKALWQENTEYADKSKVDLLETFKFEVSYISDRTSFDRLFRTHWMFLNSFRDNLNIIKYPTLYQNNNYV